MSKRQSMHRRDFLRIAGVGAGALVFNNVLTACQGLGGSSMLPAPTSVADAAGGVEVDIRAAKSEVQILEGEKTRVWQYQTQLVEGAEGSLQPIPNSYLAPVIRIRQGQTFRARLTNELDQETIIHWHGLHIPDEMDGHPRLAIAPGKTYEYEFKVINRAGTYWFHPHPHMLTGTQVFNGMAGLFIVHDENESALGLPEGEFDLPLVIQDRIFDADNQFSYVGDAMIFYNGHHFVGESAIDRASVVCAVGCRVEIEWRIQGRAFFG